MKIAINAVSTRTYGGFVSDIAKNRYHRTNSEILAVNCGARPQKARGAAVSERTPAEAIAQQAVDKFLVQEARP